MKLLPGLDEKETVWYNKMSKTKIGKISEKDFADFNVMTSRILKQMTLDFEKSCEGDDFERT